MTIETRFPPRAMSARARARSTSALVRLLVVIGAFLALSAPAYAAEEATHLFSATLSLTGDCSESTIDPVPDPGCPGGEHPPKPFTKQSGVAVDRHGDRYVASAGGQLSGGEGRIDVFSPSGAFITEIKLALPGFEVSLAVDSQGYLYVMRSYTFEPKPERLLRYKPTKYDPSAGEIEYGEIPIAIPSPFPVVSEPVGSWGNGRFPVAVDPTNDHLQVLVGEQIAEFTSATEGNSFSRKILLEGIFDSEYVVSFAVDAVRQRVYVTALDAPATAGGKPVVKAYDLKAPSDPEAPRELIFTINGSTTPTKRFVSEARVLPLAVDEATGHIFVGDLEAPTRRIYEFDASGEPVSTIEGPLKAAGVALLQLAYDDSPTSPTNGYLFVPSGNSPAHSLAFEPKPVTAPPAVENLSVSGVTTADAILHGTVNPGGVETTYRAEFTTEQAFSERGFEGAMLAGEGTLNAVSEAVTVSAAASGLSAGTDYRFRIVAKSSEGEDEADSGFTTVAPEEISSGCPNQALRTGPSAALPDCRAYELVTPANTNGHPPFGTRFPINTFTNRQVSPGGDRLPFVLEGAALSGLEGTGGFNGDPYLATRTAAGWSTAYEGPSPTEAPGMVPGSRSPDQGYSFWRKDGDFGSKIEGDSVYVRYPDGHSELVGQGSIGVEPMVEGKLISDAGTHVIFTTTANGQRQPAVQLEPDAAPGHTDAIYDRTADGILRVVSLKPGDLPFGEGEAAAYGGASLDGVGVAFEVKGVLYLRYDNAQTYEIGEGIEFAGVAAEAGNRVFYLEDGDLWRFDVHGETTTRFTQAGDVVPVYVSTDGSTAYFVSESAISGSGPNPEGDLPRLGKQNLYRSEDGQVTFVATVTERDVEGEGRWDGLGLWINANNEITAPALLGSVPARSTPDGRALLFKSRAQLTDYNSDGHAEIYRYDAAASELQCLSCNPTGATATVDADLQVQEAGAARATLIFNNVAWLENLRADGRRAFFETSEALVAADTDGLNDVYEWEAQGVGSCAKANGCLYLISSGQSGRDEFLWAVSKSGDDVFFLSQDLLAGGDTDETPSIYDARVNGGFPSPPAPAGECLGEACQPSAIAPDDPTPSSSSFQGAGNVKEKAARRRRTCPKGKRAVRRAGKSRCMSRHKSKDRNATKHHQQAKNDRRAGR